MDLNATFIGQIVVFAILLWFIYKVVTPMLAGPIGERQRRIADGLAAAEKGQEDRKSTRLNSSHLKLSRMPSSA